MKLFRSFKQPILIIVLVIFSYTFVMFQGGFVSWFIFYSMIPFAIYSLFLSFLPLAKWDVERKLIKNHFVAGESLQVEVTITRRVPFPISFIIVEDKLSKGTSSNHTIKKSALYPGFKRKIVFSYTIDELRRGEHTLGPVKIKTNDFIGFVKKDAIFLIEDKILVYPYYQQIPFEKIGILSSGRIESHEFQKDYQSGLTAGVREYQHGDRLSSIHWKATARKNEIMTKEFEQPKSQNKTIWIDRSQTQSNKGFEKSVSYTASLCKTLLEHGERVKLVSIGDEKSIFSFAKNSNGYKEVYHHLAKVRANCPSSFLTMFANEVSDQGSDGIQLIITSHLTEEFVAAVEQSIYRKRLAVFVTHTSEQPWYLIEKLQRLSVFVKMIDDIQYKKESSEVKSS